MRTKKHNIKKQNIYKHTHMHTHTNNKTLA